MSAWPSIHAAWLLVPYVALMAFIFWKIYAEIRAQRNVRAAQTRPLVPFKGWDQYYDGSADIGQIAPTFRDLNDRVSRIEPKKRRYEGMLLSPVIDDLDARLSKLEGKE